jgi:hypothetical protein
MTFTAAVFPVAEKKEPTTKRVPKNLDEFV